MVWVGSGIKCKCKRKAESLCKLESQDSVGGMKMGGWDTGQENGNLFPRAVKNWILSTTSSRFCWKQDLSQRIRRKK